MVNDLKSAGCANDLGNLLATETAVSKADSIISFSFPVAQSNVGTVIFTITFVFQKTPELNPRIDYRFDNSPTGSISLVMDVVPSLLRSADSLALKEPIQFTIGGRTLNLVIATQQIASMRVTTISLYERT